MNKINVLDCTLRDGGYINQWQFGEKNIKKIISGLLDSKVEIIECGFLTERAIKNRDSTLFDSVERIAEYLPSHKNDSMTVCMINFGEYDVKKLPQYDGTSIKGIRVAFHKKDIDEALMMCETIIDKGYKVFIQPMISVSYTDEEFINLINKSNKLKPFAFYIVDSFGVMKRKDLMRLYYLVDHNLSNDIFVGYHSHNNIQMAYSNAQALVDIKTKRELIIDSSVFGMGRGAGNLNTELFIEYLNELNGIKYKIKPLLKIIDQVLNPIYSCNFWGYSLPHYVSAMNNCHPNYASYLDDKSTLNIENINEILESLEESKKKNFDKEYIEKLYSSYQNKAIADDKAKKQLSYRIKNKTVVIIAPGRSINDEKDIISKVISDKNQLTIAINFIPENFKCDYVFVSNHKRYEDLKYNSEIDFIKTSNIKDCNSEGIVVNYSDLLNDVEAVEDNAGMMLIKLLIDIGVSKIKIAGLDGYSHDIYDNFAKKDMAYVKNPAIMDAMNRGMEKVLSRFVDFIEIEFITSPRFVRIGDSI